ncbi:acyl-CoA dehydrogenase [Actinomycetospora endophytica]|uniref:Acyl-CoA dehydrogenase n=1 Tax=Actinomycetospora endophytica TaxID=2291215 RepID=A0ABS8P8H4_9PSEU|nr:acyl-CoA dehydrogenase [Actinomycetospora endophytica]MCD2194553.1 acyl-CoA dehydrogenase [Actinomycetospora endophytica]
MQSSAPVWPDDDQRDLAEAVRTLLVRRADSGAVRAAIASRSGFDDGLWVTLGRELGVAGLAVAARHGGSGAGPGELAVVAQELGRVVAPSPWFATVLAAEVLGAASDDDPAAAESLVAIASGERRATVALPLDGRDPADPPAIQGDPAADGSGVTITGELADVLDPHADDVVVPVSTPTGPGLAVVGADALTVTDLEGLDLTRRRGRIGLDRAVGRLLDVPDPHEAVRRGVRLGLLLRAAEHVGVAGRCLDLAVEHGGTRRQFDRPIGSFQAVKHLCADLLVALEQARAALHDAVVAAQADPDGAEPAIRAAALTAADAAREVAGGAVQVLAGIGFTWEHDAHLSFRRAHASAVLFGGPDVHRRALAGEALGGAAPAPSSDGPDDLAAFAARVDAWHFARPPLPAGTRRDVDAGRRWFDAAIAYRRDLADAGLAGLTWPVDYGGQGLDPAHEVAFARGTRGHETFSEVFTVGVAMCGPVILSLGSADQRSRYLAPLLRGEEYWCQLFSEPEAGSDLASLRTRAVPDGAGWRVTGQKVWTTFAHFADHALLLARTDPEVPKHRGLTMFVVDMAAPGIRTRPLRQMTGDEEFCEVFLDDVALPADAVVGEVGGGWKAALTMLAHERRALGRDPLALAPPVTLQHLVGLVGDDEVGETHRHRVIDLWVRERALRAFGDRLAAAGVAGEDPGALASVGKLAAAGLARDVTRAAVEIAGAHGLAWDPAEPDGELWSRGVLYAPMLSIAGGTDQIQRTIIGERLLGLPREPS